MNRPTESSQKLHRRIRWLTAFFIVGLVVSGVTAIPLHTEIDWLARLLGVSGPNAAPPTSELGQWLLRVQTALHEIDARHPFVAYGGDWLAFGHFMIALAFVWAWREPVRNRWLFDFGLIACALLIPYALLLGAVRGIPLWWRLIDCSFGVFGALPLWLCRRWARELADSDSRN